MDVTCSRCGTEYEFDETLVSDRGTTVKCTNCGHLFKVYRPGAEPGADAGEERAWHVRRKNGETETLGSLRQLQQRITHGKLDEDDEISRGGEAWKKLGEIAELQTFFRAAKAAAEAERAADSPDDAADTHVDEPQQKKKSTLFGVGAPAPSIQPPSATPSLDPPRAQPPTTSTPPKPPPPKPKPPPRPPKPEPARVPPPPPKRTQPGPAADVASSVPPPKKAIPKTRYDEPAATAGAKPSARPRAPQTSQPPPRKPAPAKEQKPRLYVDEEEEVRTSGGGKSRTGLWVFLILLVGGGVAAATQWQTIAPMIGLAPADPLAEFLGPAEDALARDTEDGYEDAIREFTRASAHDERDARVLVGLARANAALAQQHRFAAEDLAASVAEGETPPASIARHEADAEEHAEESLEHAEEAARLHSGDPAAVLALADALRLTGDLEEAQEQLDRAQEMMTTQTAEFHLARALLAGEEDMSLAVHSAREAVETDPALLRGHLALARAHLARRDVEGARAAIDEVLEADAEHPYALALRGAIEEGRPPAAPVVEVPDAGVEEETPTMEPTMEPTMQAVAATAMEDRPSGGGGGNGPPPPGRDYGWYISRGDSLLERGNADLAQEYFEEANNVRPGGVEALTGLGYASLSRGRASEAARFFRGAARADYGDAYIGLGDAYRRLGQTENALRTYQAYLNSRPNGPHSTIARRQVQQLEAQLAGGGTDSEMTETEMVDTEVDTEMAPEPSEMAPAAMEEPPAEPATEPAE